LPINQYSCFNKSAVYPQGTNQMMFLLPKTYKMQECLSQILWFDPHFSCTFDSRRVYKRI